MNKENAKSLMKAMKNFDKKQLKIFYDIIVYYWVHYKAFITKQNFFNLWCELNFYCYEADEGFPSPYDDRELMKSFCQDHPYYFIDILDPNLVKNLFCQHLNADINILICVAKKIDMEDIRGAHECVVKYLEVNKNIRKLTRETQERVEAFS